jgi:ABC-type glutathione transport system ATPase component
MTALEMHDVVVTHAGRRLVDVPHLRIDPGRPVTIVGESGSG